MTTISAQNQNSPIRSADERIANTFGVGALVLAVGSVVYYVQSLLTGSAPPRGMVPFLAAAITVSASVKVCYWAVDRRVRPIEESRCQEMEELRSQREIELEEIRELRSEVRALREAVLKREGDHVATETLTAAEKFLNERGASVAHLPRVRPGS